MSENTSITLQEKISDVEVLENFIANNDDLESLEVLLSKFNIFEAIGAVRRELRHSDFIGFVLDPYEYHGLGDYSLREFLKYIALQVNDKEQLSVIDIDTSDFSESEVRREWKKIDILIISKKHNYIVAIENKIDSKEHSDQLNQYEKIINEEFPGYRKIFLYLTPEGAESETSEKWIALSYKNIYDIFKSIIKKKSYMLANDVDTLFNHYLDILDRHIMSDGNIQELCRKIYLNHKRAIDLIIEHKPDLQYDIKQYLVKLIANNNDRNIELDHPNKPYIRFAYKPWDDIPAQMTGGGEFTKSNRVILFEIRNFTDSLSLDLIIGPGDQEFREKIFNLSKDRKDIFNGKSKILAKKWCVIDKNKLLTKNDLEKKEFIDLQNMIDKKINKFFYDGKFEEITRALEEQGIK